MAGMHQFTDEGERCVSPGCRAPNDTRPSSEILKEIGGAEIGSRRARAQTHSPVGAFGSWRWRFRARQDRQRRERDHRLGTSRAEVVPEDEVRNVGTNV